MGDDRNESGPSKARSSTYAALRRFGPVALVAAGLLLGYAFGLQDYLSLDYLARQREELRAFVETNYVLSVALFAAFYITAVALSFPAASVLTIFGGFLFGWAVGGIVVAVSATAGATLLFLATRSAFGEVLRKRVDGPLRRMAEGFRENAFGYLLAIRLAPVFPFFAVNIAAALFDISLGRFVAATFLGILPGTFAYVYLGQGVDSVLMAAQASGTGVRLADLVTPEITRAFLLLAIVAAIPTVVAQWRRRRKQT